MGKKVDLTGQGLLLFSTLLFIAMSLPAVIIMPYAYETSLFA